MKKMKDLTIGFIIGGILFGIIGARAATKLEAIGVTYSNEGTSATNVEEALDELFVKASEAKGGKTLVGTYSSNATLSLSTLGYPDATADDFLVVITSAPATNKMEYYIDMTNYYYYSQIGSTAITPTWSVSGDTLTVTGMTYYAYFKNTHSTNNYTLTTATYAATWQLYYVG